MSVKIDTINNSQVKSIIENMSYGSIYVEPWDELTEIKIKKCILLSNEIAKSENRNDYFDIDTAVIDVEDNNFEGGYRREKVDGSFRIRMLQRGIEPPKLSDDDLRIDELISDSFIQKSCIKTEISPSLFKYVKKIAKLRKVKAYEEDRFLFIDSREKSRSYYQQITDAYRSGKESVFFDPELVNIPTIRVYVSSLSKSVGKKFSCSISNGLIVIRFKPKTTIEEFKDGLSNLINSYSDRLTINEMEGIFVDFISEKPEIVTDYEEEEEF